MLRAYSVTAKRDSRPCRKGKVDTQPGLTWQEICIAIQACWVFLNRGIVDRGKVKLPTVRLKASFVLLGEKSINQAASIRTVRRAALTRSRAENADFLRAFKTQQSRGLRRLRCIALSRNWRNSRSQFLLAPGSGPNPRPQATWRYRASHLHPYRHQRIRAALR